MNAPTKTACPDCHELQQLLEGSIGDSRQQELVAHLDSCTCCQRKLEGLAECESRICELVEHIDQARPDSKSAFWPALKKVENELAETLIPISSQDLPIPKARDLKLDFLEAPLDPAYLGRLGHFEISRVIGRGGMGIVLEAFDSHLQRTVAIKVLDPQLAEDETARQRFCREARAGAAIAHEHVVSVHQVEKHADKLPYLVMQLIQGETLEARIAREGKLPLPVTLRIGMQVAAGLAAAHSTGLIHRDVKPANILLEQTAGRVKLTDFGLARCIEDVKLTRTGFVTGTPLYMAPEQALGLEIDERADLFSLGAVMYEMVTGQPPFSGSTPLAVLKQITDSTARPVRSLNPDTPGWLADLIQSLLAKKPEQRPISATEVAHILANHLAAFEPVSPLEVPAVHTSGACQNAKRRFRRNSLISLAAGVVLGGIVMFVVAIPFFGPRQTTGTKEPVGPAAVATLSGNAGPVWSVAFSPNGGTLAMAIDDGNVKFWDTQTGGLKSTLKAHNGPVWAVSISPSGKLFATGHDDGTVHIWDAASETELRTFDAEGPVRTLKFAPQGEHLAVATRTGKVGIWDADTGTLVQETKGHEGVVVGIAWSPDGTLLGTASGDKSARVWNVDNGREKLRLDGHAGGVYGIAFSADNRLVATGGWDRTVRLWDAGNGASVGELKGHTEDVWAVAFSPKGPVLASVGGDRTVRLWDTSTRRPLPLREGHEGALHTASFASDGRLATAGRDGTARIWNVEVP